MILKDGHHKNRREQGTVQSDWFECTAAELAGCGHIVVYPGPGWWKERNLVNVDNIKYSNNIYRNK